MICCVTRYQGQTQKKKRIITISQNYFYKWAVSNIFRFKVWDCGFYLLLYILLPVFATIFTLSTLGTELHNAAYCYFSLMMSAISCMHDAIGRWENRTKSCKNTKLKIIIGCSVAVIIYSLFQFLAISIGGTLAYRKDAILLIYIPAVIVAVIDVLAIFSKENNLSDAICR